MTDQKVIDQTVGEQMGRAFRIARVVIKNEVLRIDRCPEGAGDVIAIAILATKIFDHLES